MTWTAFQSGVLDSQGPVAAAEKLILLNATVIMLAVILPVILLVLAFAWWFRKSNKRAQRRPNWSYSGPLEVTVWSIPLLVILFLGGIAWLSSHDLDPRTPLQSTQRPLDIQVVSLDWKWLFLYPGSAVATVNHLVVPVGRPLRLHLTSASVMNSFFVPQLGSQIYTGLSAQFSGQGFSDMRFMVDAVPPTDFTDWLAKAKSSAAALDADTYHALEKPGISGSIEYRLLLPELFDAVVHGSGKPSFKEANAR
jgi:cytochrome o ubiquinol oxidase subunit 2